MHVPVLLDEIVAGLAVKSGGSYVDGTVGDGGHTEAILRRSAPDGRVLGFDRDHETLERTRKRLAKYGERAEFVHADFSHLGAESRDRGWSSVDGIILDLGISSRQLDDPERGFSFNQDGPLDMRMDRSSTTTAADLVNQLPETELCRILREYGEEPKARSMARMIAQERSKEPIQRTQKLASIAERFYPAHGRRHPATRLFQALRIAVNGEMDALESVLATAPGLLAVGGRFGVISFHSLEDRAVKHRIAEHVGTRRSLQQGGEEWHWRSPRMSWVTRKPISATRDQCDRNPRARSAKLRIAARVSEGTEQGVGDGQTES